MLVSCTGTTENVSKSNKLQAATMTNFESISQIPRCSGSEERIVAWLVDWAKARNFPVKTDAFKNVLISVPASPGYESHDTVVLQGHTDMVCQKSDASSHDFTKDPIQFVHKDDWLHAKDTTLGADDGIGVAMALTLAETSGLAHPPLELLFTSSEETDMSGAGGLTNNFISGTKFINIDSEKEGSITLGAAGGVASNITLPLTFSPMDTNRQLFSLRIDGLLGGHSGLEIDKNRANANVLAALALSGNIPFRLVSFNGGTVDNAITRTAEMVFALSPDQVTPFKTRLAAFEQATRTQYPNETSLAISLTPLTTGSPQALLEADSAKVVKLIKDIPYGVYAQSTDFPGLPETSNNIGVVITTATALNITTFQRSFKPAKLEEITLIIEAAAANAGATYSRSGLFPPWPPNNTTALYKKFLTTYEQLFLTSMKTEVLHAGLECGYIANAYPGMEIVSIGVTLENVHTTEERLYVPSVGRLMELMTELLRGL